MGFIGSKEEDAFLPYETLEDEVIDPVSGSDLSKTEIEVAKHLLRATTEEPIRKCRSSRTCSGRPCPLWKRPTAFANFATIASST